MSDAHGHSQAPANFNRAFAIGIVLNLVFVAIESFCGWRVNSLALLADAGHNLSDVAGLVLAWGGVLAVRCQPEARHLETCEMVGVLPIAKARTWLCFGSPLLHPTVS
jgi:cobalt-zinc-cadmium efflux system protein